MWKPCSRVLNTTVHKYGFEIDDFITMGIIAAIMLFALPPLLLLIAFPAMVYSVYKIKKGKPRGALTHLLHALGLYWGVGLLSPFQLTYSPWREGEDSWL